MYQEDNGTLEAQDPWEAWPDYMIRGFDDDEYKPGARFKEASAEEPNG